MSDTDFKAGMIATVLLGPIVSIVVLLAIPVYLLDGWAMHILWGWFGPGTVLPIANAAMLSMALNWLCKGNHTDKDTKWWQSLTARILTPFSVLLMGWVLHRWVS